MSKYVQVLDKSARWDQPQFWGEPDVVSQPGFDLAAFQKKVDRICGTSFEKKSIVRFRWAWDQDCFSLFYTDWDIEGKPTASELKAKYLYKTVEIDGETVDIPPPRFVAEELIHPAQYYSSWEQNRWQYDKKLKRKVPLRPPAPRGGYYAFLYFVAAHDPEAQCCKAAEKKSDQCFGLYREPGHIDLEALNKMRFKIEHLKDRPDPYAPLGEKDLQRVFSETEAAEKERAENEKIEEEETIRDFEKIMKPAPEYSFGTKAARLPNEKITESGLIIPG